MPEKTFHMTAEEFRRCGRAVIDWIADYYARVESFPVLSQAEPGSIRAHLPAAPPARGEPFEAVLRDVEKIILPGLTHWQSPNFFAFFPANSSGPGILGDLLSTGLAVQGMLWATSPASTELETHVLDWLVNMLGLPRKFLSNWDRRRCDPGLRFERHAVRASRRARAVYERREQRAWLRWPTRGLHLYTGAFLGRQGRDDRRNRLRKPALDRG